MRKEIEILGCIEVPPEVSQDDVEDKFIEFVEKNGWFFGGGFKTIVDGLYINKNGTKTKSETEEN